MGKATADIEYDPDAPIQAYTNSSIHTHLSSYMEATKSIHGPGYDPRTEERLDPQLMMRVGQGKKHGRFWISDGVLDTASTPLHQLRASSTSSSVPIRQRPTTVSALQVSIPISFVVL
jgi:hypothetical protein